jgi:hypothetical protein
MKNSREQALPIISPDRPAHPQVGFVTAGFQYYRLVNGNGSMQMAEE